MNLSETLSTALTGRFEELAGRVQTLAGPLTEEQFWRKPFPFGNSFGHLILHLTGNLNYYIGALMAETGYVRDRPREFTETDRPAKADILRRFDETSKMVRQTLRGFSEEDWRREYSAVGVVVRNRLDMALQCVSHLDHHLGQMVYLSFQLKA